MSVFNINMRMVECQRLAWSEDLLPKHLFNSLSGM
jgi:hypothetical protein